MDLRERVAAAIDEGESSSNVKSPSDFASVSRSSPDSSRGVGTPAPWPPSPTAAGRGRSSVSPLEQGRLAMLIAEHPDATLNQLKEWGGFAVHPTTLSSARASARPPSSFFRLTYKKKTLHAGERYIPEVQAKRPRYRAKVRRIEAKRLVFVDETGVNTAMTLSHGTAGERAEGSVPSAVGSTTVIAALGLDGTALLDFPRGDRHAGVPDRRGSGAGPGTPPGDVVVFDNLETPPLLACGGVDRACGAHPLPLPPYSPSHRSRSCGRSSGDSFAGSRRGRRTACTRQSVRPWTV